MEQVESKQLLDYASQTSSLVHLYEQIEECDKVLSTMSDMLMGYQTTLGKISEEIQVLQDQSQSLALKLKNRQVKIRVFFGKKSLF